MEEKQTMEEAFENAAVPSWRDQITLRSMVTSFVLSIVFTFIVCKLNLTTGVIPSLNVAAGLLGFAIIKSWTALLQKCGLLKQPFTRQENTVIQTCVVASSGIAFSSTFSVLFRVYSHHYLIDLVNFFRVASQAEEGNTPMNVKNLSLGWMIGFLFAVSFVGLFSIVPLRKMMILKYKLTYPSGTATAYLINSFHTPKGAKLAKKQVKTLFYAFCGSFSSALFQWFFAAADGCGFGSFPTFGLKAFKQRFYFDFSATYVGVGMICPYMVNISLLIGAIVSWGIMWPQIEKKKGDWYSAQLSASSLHGIQGYRVFLAIAMMLGDGLFHVVYMLIVTVRSFIAQHSNKQLESASSNDLTAADYDEQRRTEYFLKDQIPNKVAIPGYTILAVISIIAAYAVGDPEGTYPAPYALMYRGIALLGVEGISSLPKHCLALAIGFFIAAIAMNILREALQCCEKKYRVYRFIPSPMCMAIPFYLGGYFAIDMCLGSLILFIWEKANKQKAKDFAPAVASGLICGESLWGVPAAVLSLAGAKAPICMKFLSAAAASGS
ncbi:YELLOW STRIPE like 7 [Actinidia rufa]|uniref:YELLOW STRIPE like 7 n=1 Tax=Actinidia rufa TaxID=165716 RepID=A0A7J0HEE9_9ERIC|nr:YELLOW STRIPE like 7 [Actinidia rufa]